MWSFRGNTEECITVQRRHWRTCSIAWAFDCNGHKVKGERLASEEGTDDFPLFLSVSQQGLCSVIDSASKILSFLLKTRTCKFIRVKSGLCLCTKSVFRNASFCWKRVLWRRGTTHRSVAGLSPGGWVSRWTGTASPVAAVPWGKAPGAGMGWPSLWIPVSGGQCLGDGSF